MPRSAAGAMRCKERVEAMAKRGLWKNPGGKTSHATLYSAIPREVSTKGGTARFRKVERGLFEFHHWSRQRPVQRPDTWTCWPSVRRMPELQQRRVGLSRQVEVSPMEFVGSLAISLAVAIVSALVTVRLAFGRFRAERLWERKADAYSSVIDALHHMKRDLEATDDFFKDPNPKRDERRERMLAERSEKAHDEVLKAVDTSSFLLSEKAASILQRFRNTWKKAGCDAIEDGQCVNVYEMIESEMRAVEECLADLTKAAKADLRIT